MLNTRLIMANVCQVNPGVNKTRVVGGVLTLTKNGAYGSGMRFFLTLMFLGVIIYFISDDMFGEDMSPIAKLITGIIGFIVCLIVAGLIPVR